MFLLADSNALEWTAIVLGAMGFLLGIASYLRDSQKDVRELVTQIVDGRLAAFDAAQDEIQRRLGRGDLNFDGLRERDEAMAVKLEARFGQMQKWMLENFASRNDLKDLGDRFDSLRSDVARELAGRNM
jgi:hypothetical protein